MHEGTPYIELRIDLADPPELFDLVRAFAAVGHGFDEYLAKQHPALLGEARLLVREIRQGSIILGLIPHIPALIATMDAVLIVDNFVTRYGGLLRAFIGGGSLPEISRAEAKYFLDTVRLIAKDTKGSARISSAVFKNGREEQHIEFRFDTEEAREARNSLEQKIIEYDAPVHEKFDNQLLIFWQSNKKQPKTGQSTGEKAIIESVSRKPLAIKYESDLARERIKYETTEDSKNIFKKGFYVDGYVERLNGKPVVLRITNVRDVIDLPDEEEI